MTVTDFAERAVAEAGGMMTTSGHRSAIVEPMRLAHPLWSRTGVGPSHPMEGYEGLRRADAQDPRQRARCSRLLRWP